MTFLIIGLVKLENNYRLTLVYSRLVSITAKLKHFCLFFKVLHSTNTWRSSMQIITQLIYKMGYFWESNNALLLIKIYSKCILNFAILMKK